MNIEKQTKDIMQRAITNFALKNEVENMDSQVLIYPSCAELEPKYKICKNWKPVSEVSFNELLDVKVDFLGREFIAGSFIKNCFNRIIKVNKCKNYQDVKVIIYTTSNNVKADDIRLHLFVNMKPIKELTFADLMGEQG
jgi:hypothetical protein